MHHSKGKRSFVREVISENQTMAEQQLQFGDPNTADIKLRLIGSDGAEHEKNPLYLHSQVLRKSEFYKTMLSERWSSHKQCLEVEDNKRPLEIEVTSSHNVDEYINCIKLMYSSEASKSFCFSSVDEALAILPVASELLFHDCIEECMEYLDAVRWSREQENQLLALLSSLQINTLPSLAARLGMNQCKSQCEHIESLEEFLPQLLSVISNGQESRYGLTRDGVEKYILHYFKGNAPPAVTERCKSKLLEDFMGNIDRIISYNSDKDKRNKYCSALLWLVGVIQKCDGKLLGNLLRLFCENAELRKALTSIESESHTLVQAILNTLINCFLKGMGNGEIITPSSLRVSFLKNWIGTMVTLVSVLYGKNYTKHLEMWVALDNGIGNLAETLSFGDQKLIFNIWAKAFTRYASLRCSAYQWWAAKLQDAIERHHLAKENSL